jgi:hypothetical protein
MKGIYMSLVQYNGKTTHERKRVWYNGTTTLKPGMAVCYEIVSANAVLPTSLGGAGADPSYLELGQVVVDPATATLSTFAGIVDTPPARTGVAGWIDIIIPRKGDIIDLYCKVSATALTTMLGITNAGGVNFVAVTDSGYNLDVCAIALHTIDRSTTAGYIRAKVV